MMPALPLVVALAAAVIMAPAVLRALVAGGHVRRNYRERELPFPLGVLSVAAALVALIPLAPLQKLAETDVLHPELRTIALYVLGVAVLGLMDDTLGAAPRGWRGHGVAILRGELSTGAQIG